MRPFQQFRVWIRRAPASERWTAAVVIAIVAAGFIWLAVPPSDDEGSTAAGFASDIGAGDSTGTAGGAADTGGETATAGGQDSGGQAAGTSGGGSTAAAGGGATGTQTEGGKCVSPPGSDQGITDREIKIAFMLVELVGATGNDTVNVPSKEEQKAAYDAIIDEVNKTGGVACRKIAPAYFTINPLDQAQLQQTCLDVVEAKVFYANDLGGYAAFPAIVDCYIRNKVPFYEGNFIPQKQIDESFPYLLAAGTQDNVYYNAVFGLKERGFFDPAKGFKKLGFFYQDCIPEHPQKVLRWLEQAGVPKSQIVTYNFGCPAAFYTSPADIQAAVLRFQREGVTHVTHVRGEGDWYNFTKVAQRQGYKPQYGWGDQSASFSSYGTLSPDWTNADGATLITDYRFGEERTPGLAPTAGTTRCQKIMTAHKQPDLYKQKIGMGGVACNQVWLLKSAIDHAPQLTRTSLADGLRRGGQIDFSFPHGPADFPTPRSTYHGNYWRPLTAVASCSCWRVADPNFRPTFPGYQ